MITCAVGSRRRSSLFCQWRALDQLFFASSHRSMSWCPSIHLFIDDGVRCQINIHKLHRSFNWNRMRSWHMYYKGISQTRLWFINSIHTTNFSSHFILCNIFMMSTEMLPSFIRLLVTEESISFTISTHCYLCSLNLLRFCVKPY